MDNIIEELLKIENKAKTIDSESGDYKKKLEEDVKQRIKAAEERIAADTNKELEAARKKLEQDAKIKIEAAKEEAGKRSQSLLRQYEENHVRWEEEIFNQILGR